MRALKKTVVIVILFLLLNSVAYPQEGPASVQETAGARPDQAGQAKEANRLPFEKEGWQFFVAPYMWLVGVNIGISKQGTRGATASVSVPWYDLVPDYFSKVFGAMGRVEIWKDRWGFFVDNIFLYVGDTASGGGSKKIDLPNVPVPVHLITSGTAKVIIRAGSLTVGGRYLLGTLPLSPEKPLPVLSCELLGGGRYNWYQSGHQPGGRCHPDRPPGPSAGNQGQKLHHAFHREYRRTFSGAAHRGLVYREVEFHIHGRRGRFWLRGL